MGGAVSLTVPLAASNKKYLADKYTTLSLDNDDETIQQQLNNSLAGIILFDQIDCDHSGSVSTKELKRMLYSLPRKKPVEPAEGWPDNSPPKFVPFEDMLDTLDTNKDGDITMDEWLANLAKLPGLKSAIDSSLDASGKISTYQSLEDRLVVLIEKRATKENELATINKQINSIQSSIGSAGVLVFRQIDIDHSGKIERKELLRVLKCLPRPEPVEGAPKAEKMSIDDIIARLDSDGDGIIDEAEWLANLDNLPALKASVEQAIDPATGKIIGYRSLEEQLTKLQGNVEDLEAKLAAGEDVGEELENRKAQAQKLVDKVIEIRKTQAQRLEKKGGA